MGRVDDAVNRKAAAATATDIATHQRQFVSAWADDRHNRHPATAAEPPAPDAVDPSPLLVASAPIGLAGLNAAWGELLTSAPGCRSAVLEQFRRLAAVLHKAQATDDTRLVMVTSADPFDGKTLTTVNLALVLSESFKLRVLLVDADLRRPSIGRAAGLVGDGGLSEGLKANSDQKLAVVPLTSMLTLLPAGSPDPDPMSSLTSARMRRILDEAASRFDWILIDAPPIGPIADARLLADMVDATILVVRAERTSFRSVQRAVDSVGRERLLGFVLNAVSGDGDEQYGKYATSYAAEPDSRGFGRHTAAGR